MEMKELSEAIVKWEQRSRELFLKLALSFSVGEALTDNEIGEAEKYGWYEMFAAP